ncbi:MarR family transcriptional regulator [Halotia wernerae UHCC 0503]|jgi:MarR family transcriptional regulator, organic hydroperoxide resistance regulator|nr:MarR family transcriptional regulator [Halotia wernerae UHCC 0503]
MSADSPDPFAKGLNPFICFAVYSANLAFSRVYKPFLDELGLTYPQYLALISLWAEDDQTVGQLGEKLFLESNTLTPLLKRLEGLGHVERNRDPQDERQVRVRLTAKGKALRENARCVPEGILAASGTEFDALRKLSADITSLRERLLAADSKTPR